MEIDFSYTSELYFPKRQKGSPVEIVGADGTSILHV
jgi:hypothetical protein